MLRPEKMKQVSILVLKRETRAVMECLGRMGTFQVAPLSGVEETFLSRPDCSTELERVSDLARRIHTLHRILFAEKELYHEAPSEFQPLKAVEKGLQVLEERLSHLEEKADTLSRRKEKLLSFLNRIEAFLPFSSPMESIQKSDFLHFAIGQIPERRIKPLEEEAGERALILPYRAVSHGSQRVIVITSKRGRWALDTALASHGFSTEDAGGIKGRAPEIASRILKTLEDTKVEEENLVLERKRLQDEALPLMAQLGGRIDMEKRILRAEENFGQSGYFTLIQGWVPEMMVNQLCHAVLEATGDRAVLEIQSPPLDREARKNIPVLFKNPRFLRPFERLVKGFGHPAYDDIEPTLFVALSFLFMFGMMFGDVGHGAVLLILGLLLNRMSSKPLLRDFGAVYAWAGCAAIFFGILYGSTFGKEGLPPPLWVEPRHHIAYFLPFALALGILVLSMGVILNIVNRIRKKEFFTGFFHRYGVIGFFLYWGALGLGIKAAFTEKSITSLEIVFFILLPLALLFFHEPVVALLAPERKGKGGRLLSSFIHASVELIETLSAFLANTMSFVRVGAFALAHSLLCVAIFNVAEIVSDFPGGPVLSVLAIVFGNILVIFLEGMVVTIQVVRLEYYEFFSRFFTGEGKAFQPFDMGKKKET